MAQTPGSPGRRLRLDRRKAGLSQAQLADLLGTDVPSISAMENNQAELSTEAKAFIAVPPAAAPKPKREPKPKVEPEQVADPLPQAEEEQEGTGPRDRAPQGPKPRMVPVARDEEIKELQEALTYLFAGQEFLVPRTGTDGEVTYHSAAIPGVAQLVGAFDEFDGQMIKMYAPSMAHAWAEVARENEMIRKWLIGLTYGGAYRGVVAASLPPLLAIMGHHGLLPFARPVAQAAEPEHAPAG